MYCIVLKKYTNIVWNTHILGGKLRFHCVFVGLASVSELWSQNLRLRPGIIFIENIC